MTCRRTPPETHRLSLTAGAWGCILLLIAFTLITSCTQKMAQQPRYDPLAKSDFFANGMAARPLPIGVISRDYALQDEPLDTGFLNGKPAENFPFPVTREVLERGQQRYNIYCAPCHDYVGTGDGMVARRGLRSHPANFHTDELRSRPPGHFVDVMINGFGAMPSYAKQLPARDRWAVVAYIRALQLSQSARIEDVPMDERSKLESQKQ